MSMYCFQCQENAGNEGCRFTRGVCGKPETTAKLMDVLIFSLRGLSLVALEAKKQGKLKKDPGLFIAQSLFTTITNANFDEQRIVSHINEALKKRDEIKSNIEPLENPHESVLWSGENYEQFQAKAPSVGVLSQQDEDVCSLREMLIYGLKGISAYYDHAAMLGFEDEDITRFIMEGLASTTQNLSAEKMTSLVLKAGEYAVKTMALLDKANTETYGNPEITEVNIGVGINPGILISGHDLRDMEELLKQTEGSGVDIYTHGEMLPANYYPAFKKYKHFIGNYGSSWWHQNEDFEAFNGPILMTTNCIIPIKGTYQSRIFTTGMVGYPGVDHIADRENGKQKDFSRIIALAKTCPPPKELETGKIVGGFAHNQVIALADKVVAAIKSGAIKRFIVMGGCDGRHKERSYFTEVAETLPPDAVILTAGCAKFRYIKLNLGDIGGIPRVLDAGQCNDSYSLAVIALKLKEVFGAESINDLPISFDIAWYEQKAVAVLLALLFLGIKGIRLGPTLPAFLSKNVLKVLVEKFDIKPIGDVADDVAAMMMGK